MHWHTTASRVVAIRVIGSGGKKNESLDFFFNAGKLNCFEGIKKIQSYHSRCHIYMKWILLVVQVIWKIGRFKAIFPPLCCSGLSLPTWLRCWYSLSVWNSLAITYMYCDTFMFCPFAPTFPCFCISALPGKKTWAGIANRQWGNCKYRHWVGGHRGGCHLWLQSGERLLLYFASPHRWVRLLRSCQPICKPEPELASH